MKEFFVRVTRELNGYEDLICCEATVEAETAADAMNEVLAHWAIEPAPKDVGTVFENTADEFHSMNGRFSYDVCPAEIE